MAKVHDMPPIKYMSLPFQRWLEIETIADRRLRVEAELMGGSMGMTDAREDFGRRRVVDETDLHPTLQMQLANAKMYEAQATELPKQTEVAKEQVEVSKTAAKTKPAPSSSGQSDKNRK